MMNEAPINVRRTLRVVEVGVADGAGSREKTRLRMRTSRSWGTGPTIGALALKVEPATRGRRKGTTNDSLRTREHLMPDEVDAIKRAMIQAQPQRVARRIHGRVRISARPESFRAR